MAHKSSDEYLKWLLNNKTQKLKALQVEQSIANAVYEARLSMLMTDIHDLENQINYK